MKKLFLILFFAVASVTFVSHEIFATMPADDATDSYTGNGSTTAFTYNFKLLDQAHIKVLVDGVTKAIGTDYTIAGVGVSTGGTVTFLTAPANTARVVLLRNSPIAQSTNYVANSAYSATRVMADLDRVIAVAQQLQEQVTRAYKMAPGYTIAALPTSCPGTQKMIGFDATGAIACSTDLNAAAAAASQWDQITAPSGNASLSMANNRSTFTWGAATGANPTLRLTDTASNTGTGALLQLDTAPGSTAKPFQATIGGTANGVQMSTAGSLAKIGTGDLKASSLETSVNVFGVANNAATTTAFNALDPLTTKGDIICHNGTDSIRIAVGPDGQRILADSTQPCGIKWGDPALDRVTADTAVTNTVTETTVYSYTVPAGTLSTNRRLRLVIQGKIGTANGAGTHTITVRTKYGGTTLNSIVLGNYASASSTASAVRLQVLLSGDGATNAQLGHTEALVQSPISVVTANLRQGITRGTSAIDSTVNQTFLISVEWNTANASNSFVMEHAILEIL